jgi:signal transduction histidine kinase/DNA-binding response OmpR family regulator
MPGRLLISFFSLLIFLSVPVYAQKIQDSAPDEKEKNLSSMPGDTAKANLLISLAEKYRDTDAGRSGRYAYEAISLSQKLNYSQALVRAYNLVGRIRQYQNKIPAAYELFQKAYKVACSVKDSMAIAECYHNIGDLYKWIGMQEESIDYLKKALKIAQQMHDSIAIPMYADRLGHVYMDWGEATKDKKNFNEALQIYNYSRIVNEKINNEKRLSVSYVNLANANLVFFKHGGSDSCLYRSLRYSEQGVRISEESGARSSVALNILNLGEAYYLLKNYDKAIDCFNKSLAIYTELDKKTWIAAVYRDFALVYKEKKEYSIAIDYLEKSNKILVEFNDVEPYENYQVLSELYADKGDHESAFKAYKKYQDLLNREQNTKSMLEIERLQLEFETERKDKAIELLSKENQLDQEKLRTDKTVNFLLVGLTLFVIILSVLLYNRSRILKRSKELSDHARIMQEQFLANTSHEIRTPMNGIIGMTNHLLETPLTPDQQQHVRTIKMSADNLLRIINDVLDLSKISAGKLDFQQKDFVSDILFHELHKLLLPRAVEKGLSLKFTIDRKVPIIFVGDALRLEQVLINIISNAIKFTERGVISLEVNVKKVTGDEHLIEFRVRDTGIGIPEKKLDAVFDDFVQIENAGNRKHGGAGLGLSITRRLIEMQNGQIKVNSRLGEGTEFLFEIPFRKGSFSNYISKLYHKNSLTKHEKDLKHAKILVIEDNTINQQVIANTLSSWNADYAIAEAAVEGFDMLSQQHFDLILMDIELPGISGWEATQYIRTKFGEDKKHIPVIALTAYAYESDKQKSIDCGMNDVVVKPFSPDELYFKMRAQLYHETNTYKEVIPKKEVNAADSLFNFESLKERYAGNDEGLKEILELFINEVPVYINELEELNKKQDIEGVKKQAHKMKSPLALIGSADIVNMLQELNSYEALKNGKKRNELVTKISSDGHRLIIQLNVKYGEMQL